MGSRPKLYGGALSNFVRKPILGIVYRSLAEGIPVNKTEAFLALSSNLTRPEMLPISAKDYPLQLLAVEEEQEEAS